MLLIEKYSLEKMRAQIPKCDHLTDAQKERAMFYLGAVSVLTLVGEAQKEIEERQKVIVDLIHDEIDTELLILQHNLRS